MKSYHDPKREKILKRIERECFCFRFKGSSQFYFADSEGRDKAHQIVKEEGYYFTNDGHVAKR